MEETETYPTWAYIDIPETDGKVEKLRQVVFQSYPQLSPTPLPHISLSRTHMLTYTQAHAIKDVLIPRIRSIPQFSIRIQTDPACFRLLSSQIERNRTYGALVPCLGIESIKTLISTLDGGFSSFGLPGYTFEGLVPHLSLGVTDAPMSASQTMEDWPVKSLTVSVRSAVFTIGQKLHVLRLE